MSKIADLVQVGIESRVAKIIAAQWGWCDIDEAWTYASASTITVPAGAASRFQIGDKLRIDNTTTKYFYVIGVADTLLTVTGGASYTVANDTISKIAYSRFEQPFGFPTAFSFAPAAGTNIGTLSLVTRGFRIDGPWLSFNTSFSGDISAGATSFTITGLPVAAFRVAALTAQIGTLGGICSIAQGATSATLSRCDGGAMSGVTTITITGKYRIA